MKSKIVTLCFLLFLTLVLISTLTACAQNAPAKAEALQLSQLDPQKACSVFSDIEGMQTRGYRQIYELEYRCSSPYKEFGGGYPMKNNIAYYVSGNAKEVKELKLVLNVNTPQEAKGAHQVLSKYAELLTAKALGAAFPDKIKNNIVAGKSGEWQIARAKVLLTRSDWSTGKGYDLKFIIGY